MSMVAAGSQSLGDSLNQSPWRLCWFVGPHKTPVTGGALCQTSRAYHNQFTCLCTNTHTDYIIYKHYKSSFFLSYKKTRHEMTTLNHTPHVFVTSEWPNISKLLLLRLMWIQTRSHDVKYTDVYIDLGKKVITTYTLSLSLAFMSS